MSAAWPCELTAMGTLIKGSLAAYCILVLAVIHVLRGVDGSGHSYNCSLLLLQEKALDSTIICANTNAAGRVHRAPPQAMPPRRQ